MVAREIRIDAWHTPKVGSTESEYEDAFAASDTNAATVRVAVADGATDATFSGLWASLLVSDFAAGNMTAETFTDRAQALAQEWARQVAAQPLPWHAAAKVERDGSSAAFVGVSATRETGEYLALSVGDCALFHLRPETENETGNADDYRMVTAFPLARSADFAGVPVLVGTQSHVPPAHVQTHTGTLEPSDILFLMSDALAAWFLREMEANRAPTRWLAPLGTKNADAAITETVRYLRETDRLKNDDVTVARIIF